MNMGRLPWQPILLHACTRPPRYMIAALPGLIDWECPSVVVLEHIPCIMTLKCIPHDDSMNVFQQFLKSIITHPASLYVTVGSELQSYRPYSHKLLTINNYVNCPSNFAFAHLIYLFHPPIFEKIFMQIRSIAQ